MESLQGFQVMANKPMQISFAKKWANCWAFKNNKIYNIHRQVWRKLQAACSLSAKLCDDKPDLYVMNRLPAYPQSKRVAWLCTQSFLVLKAAAPRHILYSILLCLYMAAVLSLSKQAQIVFESRLTVCIVYNLMCHVLRLVWGSGPRVKPGGSCRWGRSV